MAGLLDAIAGSNDPSTADPNTGLVEAQRRQLLYSALGQTGAALLAAGAPTMPGSGQQQQAFLQLGNVGPNVAAQQAQYQQGNLMNQRNIAAQRENQQREELRQYVNTPEFRAAFDGLPPGTKAIANAQMKSGDIPGMLKTVQESRVETTPKFNPDGSFYLPATKEYVDPVRGIRMKVDDVGKPGGGSVAGFVDQSGAPLAGEELAKRWAPGYANTIRAYAEGRQKVPDTLARTVQGQKILADIAAYDPTFDMVNYNQRNKAAIDFAPQGKTGQAIIQNNTVIEHSAQLLERARALNNTSFPIANSVLNIASEQQGESPVTRFNQQKLRLIDEMAKLLKGGQASEGEINRQLAALHAAQSPEQLQSGIEDIIEAAESRKSSQLAQYETAMGRKPTAQLIHAYHNPEAEAYAATVKANPLPGSTRHSQMQQRSATPPAQGSTSAPAPGQPSRAEIEAELRRRGLLK